MSLKFNTHVCLTTNKLNLTLALHVIQGGHIYFARPGFTYRQIKTVHTFLYCCNTAGLVTDLSERFDPSATAKCVHGQGAGVKFTDV